MQSPEVNRRGSDVPQPPSPQTVMAMFSCSIALTGFCEKLDIRLRKGCRELEVTLEGTSNRS